MGQPKASLQFGSEPLLVRVLGTVAPLVDCLVVVAADGQDLPALPAGVLVARDQNPDRGPLEGLCTGLETLWELSNIGCAFVGSCDLPLLKPEFVARLFASLQSSDQATVPRDAERSYPLTAVYRTNILPTVHDLLSRQELRVRELLQRVSTRWIDVDFFREVDPNLDSLWNVNTPADYLAALAKYQNK